MAVTKRYTEQIVVMQTSEMGAAIKEIADTYGISVAQVARDAQTLGLPLIEGWYKKIGVAPAKSPAQSPAESARRAGRDKTAGNRIGTKRSGKIPQASFVSATGVEKG